MTSNYARGRFARERERGSSDATRDWTLVLLLDASTPHELVLYFGRDEGSLEHRRDGDGLFFRKRSRRHGAVRRRDETDEGTGEVLNRRRGENANQVGSRV